MSKVKVGDVVSVHYHGRLKDGTTFDSSDGRDPLQFKVGAGQVIKGFDNALIDMQVGDKKTVEIPVEDAYGAAHEENFVTFPITEFPPEMKPEIGMGLQLHNNEGHVIPVVIHEVRETEVVLNANHPLAGKDLIFDLELVTIG